MILSRHEFRMWIKLREPKFYPWDSLLWCMETKYCKPEWFVSVRPVSMSRLKQGITKQQYWDWRNENMSGKLLCYWSADDVEGEWWGFTNKDDIALWLLKWSN